MEEFRTQLISVINDASKRLSAEAIYYIVKDLYRDIDDSYAEYLKAKEEERKKESVENNKED